MELHKWGESKQATHFIFNTVRKPLDGILELQIPGEGGYWHAFLLNKTLYVAAVSSASAEEEGDVFPAFEVPYTTLKRQPVRGSNVPILKFRLR